MLVAVRRAGRASAAGLAAAVSTVGWVGVGAVAALDLRRLIVGDWLGGWDSPLPDLFPPFVLGTVFLSHLIFFSRHRLQGLPIFRV